MSDPITESTITSSDWKAWHDFMPGSQPTLHVKGTVTVPTSGYTAKLQPATPQGINPAIYLIDLIVTPPAPDEIVSPVLTPLEVYYMEITSQNYTQVSILPDGIIVDVEVVS